MRIFEESENVAPFLMNPETYDPMSPTGFRRRQIEVMGVEAGQFYLPCSPPELVHIF